MREVIIASNSIPATKEANPSTGISPQGSSSGGPPSGANLSPEEVCEVYVENLRLVLRYAEKLSEHLEGETVISSDHRESLGNPSTSFSSKYGHGGYAPEVRTVPWLELGYERRKEVMAEEPLKSEGVNEDILTEQLEHLGYL